MNRFTVFSTSKFQKINAALVFLIFLPFLKDSPTAFRPICMVQGRGGNSPFEGDFVTVQGIVTGDLDSTSREGFFIQEEGCDQSPLTSDGIFIYTGVKQNLVTTGDLVIVSGWVNEYFGMTEISADPQDILVVSQGEKLPAPRELYPSTIPSVAAAYFESLEGMLVSLSEGVTIGPTDAYDRSWLVRVDLGIQRVFWDDPLGTGEIVCADDGGLFEITPKVKVGDRVRNLSGVLDYRFERYCVEPLAMPEVLPQDTGNIVEAAATAPGINTFTLATFNLGNLFDTLDDPTKEDTVLSATAYQRKLDKLAMAIHAELGEPAVIALQEAENSSVILDLINQHGIISQYDFLLEEGPDERGLDIALIYRTDLVQLVNHQVLQGCTNLVDGLGPDGNLDVLNPQNQITCDRDGDGILDGNRLFSRPLLVARLNICLPGCSQQVIQVNLMLNHWKSKSEDTTAVEYTLPRRLEQAQFVASAAEQVRIVEPGIPLVMLGDFNDTPGSQPLSELTGVGFQDLIVHLPKSEQYSYNYQGVSQVLDHVLIEVNPSLVPMAVDILHFNSDFPYSYSSISNTPWRSSDHDAVRVQFGVFDHLIYLPLITVP